MSPLVTLALQADRLPLSNPSEKIGSLFDGVDVAVKVGVVVKVTVGVKVAVDVAVGVAGGDGCGGGGLRSAPWPARCLASRPIPARRSQAVCA